MLKANDDITVADSKSITTNGSNVIFWSNSDNTGDNGYILLRNNSSIISNAGNVWLGGGSGTTTWNELTVGNGYATAGAEISSDTFVGSDVSDVASGIYLENTSINTGGGNFAAYGNGDDPFERGILAIGDFTLNSESGKIYLDAKSNNEISLIFGHHSFQTTSEVSALTSSNTDTDAITVNTVSQNSVSESWSYGTWVEGTTTAKATNGGGIVWTTEGAVKGVNLGYSPASATGVLNLLANSGDITLNTKAKGINIQTTGAINLGRKTGTSVTTSVSDITVIADDFSSATSDTFNFNTSGVVSISPQTGNAFESTFDTSNLTYSSDVSGLTIGHSSNTGNITVGSATEIAGPISLFGGVVAVNSPLTATNNTISITSSTSLTDGASGYLNADGLALNGAGTVTLDHTSNDINTIAAGSSSSPIGALSYTDADDLTIGTVNPTGIHSSGAIELGTLSGDLELTEPIVSTQATGDAIQLYADKDATSSNEGDGNITITNNGLITVESGARALLYSGKETESTGVQAAVGGESNTRTQVDANTDLSTLDPVIGNTGKYAL
ncbi:MAG: hypothetical protein ABF263_08895, partial [Polaribacter sp.]